VSEATLHKNAEPISLTPSTPPVDEQAAVWERLSAQVPEEAAITAEAVAGEEETKEEETPVKSDRDLVAPKIAEFLQKKQAEAAEPPKQEEPENLTAEQLILKKLERIEQEREAQLEAQRRQEEEAYWTSLADATIDNVSKEKDKYPGLFALGQESTLVELVRSGATSEFEAASKIEEAARATYEKLHAIYGATETPSEAPAPVAATTPEPTISNQLVSADAPLDLEGMSPQEAQQALWDKIINRG
jgi:hypothetical protein